MKIVADSNIPFVKEAFSHLGEVTTVSGREITKALLKEATLLIVRSITEVNSTLLENTGIRFVGTTTIGTDHVDTTYLKEKCIGFASAPGSNANSVAEYVLAAMVAMATKIKRPLSKLTLGIVGVGNIGSRVFQMAKSLGISCILTDPPKQRLTQSPLYRSLDELLESSDIITLHVPLKKDGSDTTAHMVNKQFIELCKKGVVLINTSRGQVVDESALLSQKGKFGGLIFDVWENEPHINFDLLSCVDIGTPHIAGYSYDGKIGGVEMIYKAACAFFFKEVVWRKQEVLDRIRSKKLTFSDEASTLEDAVSMAYDILEDAKKFKEVPRKDPQNRGTFFDSFRKNYPRRLEFSHYSFSPDTLSEEKVKTLSNVGFSKK